MTHEEQQADTVKENWRCNTCMYHKSRCHCPKELSPVGYCDGTLEDWFNVNGQRVSPEEFEAAISKAEQVYFRKSEGISEDPPVEQLNEEVMKAGLDYEALISSVAHETEHDSLVDCSRAVRAGVAMNTIHGVDPLAFAQMLLNESARNRGTK